MNILMVDDDASLRRSLRLTLETLGHTITETESGAGAQTLLGQRMFDVALVDLRLARESGLDAIPALLRLAPGLAILVMTAYATIETAVEAMRRGAMDYLPKPFTPSQLRVALDRVMQLR